MELLKRKYNFIPKEIVKRCWRFSGCICNVLRDSCYLHREVKGKRMKVNFGARNYDLTIMYVFQRH